VPRIRTVKPAFFKNFKLYKAEQESGLPLRLAFEGLWTVADREGRFEWIPEQIKTDVLPYDQCDFSQILNALEAYGYVISYEVNGKKIGVIPKFSEHQVVNVREAQSTLPAPPEDVHTRACTGETQHTPNGINIPSNLRETVYARDSYKCVRCGASNDLTIDHIFPQSMGGNHAISNLRTLCRSCNSARPVAGQKFLDDLSKDGLTLNDMQRMCMHVHARVERKGKEKEWKGIRVTDALPDWLDKEAWATWNDHRAELRKKQTAKSIASQIRFLEKYKADHTAILDQSVRNGWTGLFELKADYRKPEPSRTVKDFPA
jgi:hypothetical protein